MLDRNLLRYLLLPGTDIFTRRRTRLEKNWLRGPRRVLDAGFGNGWFSYRAYKSGATVTSIAIGANLVDKANALYNDFLGISRDKMSFQEMNLYEAGKLDGPFDEIICYETLEHVRDDAAVCRTFHRLLRPGGVLHLCCPNAEHPRWRSEQLDSTESGGHVRHGYTERTFLALLEPLGFRVDRSEGVGGSLIVFAQEKVQTPLRRLFGEPGAATVAVLAAPFIALDAAAPAMPFSIYVRAVRDSPSTRIGEGFNHLSSE
ncbi:MAG TPA: class I SAM-dependent methyltransferase [Xanthobacteraceae bacterium]|jgi:SAM-dependent methyltransferase|nr:class I SAM-dependent methyltransferase [Xanthobacteraceae bacterium]